MSKSPNPADKAVGERVRQARMLLHMSQPTLGNVLGVTFQQVQKYEKGTNRIGAGRLQQIAATLQRPVEWFFEGVTVSAKGAVAAPKDDPLQELGHTRDGIAMARAFLKMPERLRHSFVRLAEETAEGRK